MNKKKMQVCGLVLTIASLPFVISAATEIKTVDSVVSLTNELANLPDKDVIINLQPGVYDLRGVKMAEGSHLRVDAPRNLTIAGLGQDRSETILLGGGESDLCRVLDLVPSDNYRNIVSNLTVTGGYSQGSGAGIKGNPQRASANWIVDCIISNNVSLAKDTKYDGGGGVYCGCAVRTLFADNSSANAGGAIHCGKSYNNILPFVEECEFVNNRQVDSWGNEYGGGAVSCGVATNCTFINNSGVYGGALGKSIYGGSSAYGCRFTGEATATVNGAISYGRPLYDCKITNITINASEGFYSCTLSGCEISNVTSNVKLFNKCNLSGCTISDVASSGREFFKSCTLSGCLICDVSLSRVPYVFHNSRMTGCVVRDCSIAESTNGFDFDCAGDASITNDNCLFVGNHCEYGTLFENKTLVNCTVVSNRSANSNYGLILASCEVFNSVLTGNKVGNELCDVRTVKKVTNASVYNRLTNCVITASDASIDAVVFGNCRMMTLAEMRFADPSKGDFTPLLRSPLRDAGYSAPWLQNIVGATDLSGQLRVVGDGIDIGAFECQDLPTAMRIIVR